MTQKQLFDLPFGPGQYTEQSERGAKGRWYSMDKVRFRAGLAEKIGGWTKLQPQFLGICRRLRDWSSLDAKRWTAIGTDTKLYVWQDGTLYDITPVRRTVTLTAPFTTQNAPSLSVTVHDVNHGAQAGDYVRIENATVGGSSGILVDGEYQVVSVTDTDNFVITVTSAATGPGSSGEGGSPTFRYDISAGASSAIAATGYGTGPYGREGYGTARTGSTLVLGIRTWSLDTWGEDLLASPRGGAIYWWDRSKGTGSRAEKLGGDSPQVNQYMVVSQRDRHVIALGAYDYFNNAVDPMLIRWCSTEDLNDWVPTATNTAGDLRLYSGSKIVAGVRSRLETVIFTDVSVHTLPYVGGYDVFGLNVVGENVSILGPNAAVPIDARVIFMAESDFYIYDGIVRVIPCDVRNFVYDNLNTLQRDKVYGGLNREFNEVWFFYPSYEVNGWLQTDLSLGLPQEYQVAQSSELTGDDLIADVVFMLKPSLADGNVYGTNEIYDKIRNVYGIGQGTSTFQSGLTPSGDSAMEPDLYGASAGFYFAGVTADHTAWSITNNDPICIEAFIKLMGFTVNDTDQIIISRRTTSAGQWAIGIIYDTALGAHRMKAWIGSNLITTVTIPETLIDYDWYHIAFQYHPAANASYFCFNGTIINARYTNKLSQNPTETGLPIHVGVRSTDGTDVNLADDFRGQIDAVRITKGVRYTGATSSSYTIPSGAYPEVAIPPGTDGDIGYSVSFNSGGYTEITTTANNGYEYDYYLVNPSVILTPRSAEYAVEFSFNPDFTYGDISFPERGVGLVFLRNEISGTAETASDDASGIYAEINNSAGSSQGTFDWFKKGADGVKDWLDANPFPVDVDAVLGAGITNDTKYILSVRVDDDVLTAYINGIFLSTVTLSPAESAFYVDGSFGIHIAEHVGETFFGVYAPATSIAKFYNLATTPLDVITSSGFDISPVEVNRYVIFNYEEGSWATGTMSRTAWADRSPLLEKPYAAGVDGYLYKHETGTDDDGAAMPSFLQSFDMEVPESGEQLMHVDQLVPDFLTLEGSVDIYLSGKKYPQDTNRISKGPYTVINGTRKVSTRIRARQIAIRVESNDIGDKWRMGTLRGRAGPHGKRG